MGHTEPTAQLSMALLLRRLPALTAFGMLWLVPGCQGDIGGSGRSSVWKAPEPGASARNSLPDGRGDPAKMDDASKQGPLADTAPAGRTAEPTPIFEEPGVTRLTRRELANHLGALWGGMGPADDWLPVEASAPGRFSNEGARLLTSSDFVSEVESQLYLLAHRVDLVPALGTCLEPLEFKIFAGMDRKDLKVTRSAPNVNVDWGDGPADPAVAADHFSATWKGNIVAPVSGMYTFYANTDNGRALIIDGKRIIDALVSDFNRVYTGMIALEKGHSYSFELDYFEDTGGASAKLEWSAEGLARQVIPREAFQPTGGAQSVVECVTPFLESFGARAFRRPLTADEKGRYLAFVLAEATAGTPVAQIVQSALEAMALSPQSIFKTSIGAPVAGAAPELRRLTPYEVASQLSFLITENPPDDALLQIAAKGGLTSAQEVAVQARRLLAKKEVATGARTMLRELFATDEVTKVTKDATAFPAYSPAVAADLRNESELFVDYIAWESGGGYKELLLSDVHLRNKALAQHYGEPIEGLDQTFKVINAGKVSTRLGILSQGAFLAGQAAARDTFPIRRGRFIRERLLCNTIASPPAGQQADPLMPQPSETTRESLARHVSSPACAACHKLMDPIGLVFEGFDATGVVRTLDHGKPVDTSGELALLDGQKTVVADERELASALATAPGAQACFRDNILRHVLGRSLREGDEVARDALRAAFDDEGGSFLRLYEEAVHSDAFLTRRFAKAP